MRSLRDAALLLGLPLCLASSACASAAAKDAASAEASTSDGPRFPSQKELTKLAAAPTPAHLFDDKGKDVPTWDLLGPLPDAVDAAPHEGTAPLEKLLADAIAARPDRAFATEAMFCVARENTLFYLANQSLPAEPLERFITARCGAPTGSVEMEFQGRKSDARSPENKLIAELEAPTKKMIQSTLKEGHPEVGIFFAQKDGHAVVGLASAPRKVTLERTSLVPAVDGKVIVRGELLHAAGGIRGVINRGRYGFARCAVDLKVPLPRFAVECPALPADEAAWLEIGAFPPGRILGDTVLEMLVWPSGAPKKTYAKLSSARDGEGPALGQASLPALVQEINKVRKEGGLAPVALAEQQSRTASELAPHYFAAVNSGDAGAMAEQVMLGLRAGWDVGGTVRYGTFVSTWVRDASDYSDLLRAALSRPFGREALLDPEVERVAIGTVASDKAKILAGVFSTYALFDGYKHDKDSATVLARITALRAARGLTAPEPLRLVAADATGAAASVQAGKRQPGEALKLLLDVAVERLQQGVQGFVIETSSLDELRMPDALLNAPTLSVVVGVAHYRRDDQPWGRFIILGVAVQGSAPVMTAESIPGARPGRNVASR